MNAIEQAISYKGRQIKTGDSVTLLEPIENGAIRLHSLDGGRIVRLHNQTEADVWMSRIGFGARKDIQEALKAETGFGVNGALEGVVVSLKAKSFAVGYIGREHGDLTIAEEKAQAIPFYEKNEALLKPSRFSKNVGGVFQPERFYLLDDLAEKLDEAFEAWTKRNAILRKATDDDFAPDGCEMVLDGPSQERFGQKREELELAFAKASGVYRKYTGGLMVD